MMKRKSHDTDPLLSDEDSGAWMVTFADLMTLLLVFFVLLYSLSSLNLEKFKSSIESIKVETTGSTSPISLLDLISKSDYQLNAFTIEDLTGLSSHDDSIIKDVSNFIRKKQIGDKVLMHVHEGKIIIRIMGQVLFKSGSAILNIKSHPILNQIAYIVQEYPEYNVNIKGHTDNIPISTNQFASNWELSAIRATTVLKYMIKRGVNPLRLTATGYADILPLVKNNSNKNRITNRRVEFVLEKKTD